MDRSPVDPGADRPVYRQVADDLRRRIGEGELPQGQPLPAEPDLMWQYAVGRNTLRQALSVLRGEGLIETNRSRAGNVVRKQRPHTPVPVAAGTEVTARMPTEAERREHDIPEGVPVMVLTSTDGTKQVLPADRFMVVAGDDV
ncbi:GntR family transcriptional regulator [Actinomadura madurae]|uniref:GntR family transcriptional regulator n=1 Tax=Actinomadura madurae TaxID=1993 RepID=UPI0020D22B81|nr:GntR family transcriptional regulator [Actinomadura madurae]MCP9947304.1 GntR family transcriptional regulator [Actinomadura madurae]MCP9964065.1 GntR family transcriptional regulator [Actinomadura madurae]MCQ0011962.1 GntR family transcriptional regulator [Actinomadura madurae]MCQ0012736.1 GntR family transcriptional regulator [Actinomadura madurae]